MKYKLLKRLRVVLSVVMMALLTWCVVDSAFEFTSLGEWVMSTQLVPAILAGSALWMVLWILITLTFGRVYCSTVCPLGTLQDVAGRLGRMCSKGEWARYRYLRPHNTLRFIMPAVAAVCLFVGFTVVVTLTDPATIYGKIVNAVVRPCAMTLGGLLSAAVLLLGIGYVSWRRGRLLCNTICPAGGLLGLMSRNPVYRVDVNTDKCLHCGRCVEVCKSGCINPQDSTVDNSRCVMCINCVASCPNDAIVIRRGKYRLSTPMMQALRN